MLCHLVGPISPTICAHEGEATGRLQTHLRAAMRLGQARPREHVGLTGLGRVMCHRAGHRAVVSRCAKLAPA